MKPRILVVEDETHLAQGLKYNLEAEGYKISLVDNGTTAMKLLENDSQAYDLLILDLMLPGLSGYAICERLRTIDESLPVLILSARSLAEDRSRGFDVGANQYLTPLTAKVIEIRFGRATVNFETYEVTVDSKEVKLTHKELSLLRYFVENEGRVISRQELLTEVWDLSGEMQTRSVDQFMLRLRKTFEIDPANPKHFLTIRDAGYRFVEAPAEAEES